MRSLVGIPCAVLGGGGFIGGHLCASLADAGAVVRAFGRSDSGLTRSSNITWTRGDFGDRAAIARVVGGVEVVFHLLGGSTPESSNNDPLGDLLGSLASSIQLLEICKTSGVRKIVFVSSGGTVYGVPKELPIAETSATDPISAYGINKLSTEKYLKLYHYLHGLDYVVMRLANPFGPGQYPNRRQGFIAAQLHSAINRLPMEIWGDGKVIRDYVFISDVVDALMRATIYSGPSKIFNVGSGVGRSILEVVRDIGKVIDVSSLPPIHKAARATDVPVNVLNISLIERELAWAPSTDWMEALRLTARWMTGKEA